MKKPRSGDEPVDLETAVIATDGDVIVRSRGGAVQLTVRCPVREQLAEVNMTSRQTAAVIACLTEAMGDDTDDDDF